MTMSFGDVELTPRLARSHTRALRLEWATIGCLAITATLTYVVLGSSQAMKAAWVEDLLSFLPPLAFLIASRIRRRRPDPSHPYGYHRAVSIAYLVAATALAAMGAYLIYDSGAALLAAEHPPIGLVVLLDSPIWSGWLMLSALAVTIPAPVVLGRLKLRLAAELHDKVLYADAAMNRADWMTATGAMLGIVGIGVGLWWADAVAALLIGASVTRDGATNLRTAVADLMDARASRYDDRTSQHPLVADVHDLLAALPWVNGARVRVREEGHVFGVEAFVAVDGPMVGLVDLERARTAVRELDWKLQDVVIVPVRELPLGTA